MLLDVPETSRDTYGQPSQAPTAIGTFWVDLQPLRGDEMLNVRQIWPLATHLIKLRYTFSAIPANPPRNPNGYILPNMKFQLVKDNRIFNILSALNVEERNIQWLCTVQEHVGATS